MYVVSNSQGEIEEDIVSFGLVYMAKIGLLVWTAVRSG